MSQQSDTWIRYFESAQRDRRIGDLHLLAEEAPSAEQKAMAYRTTAGALVEAEHVSYARTHFGTALELDPTDSVSRQQLAALSTNFTTATKVSGHPRHVFLFTGHMIDKKGRKEPRFPPDKEPLAAESIARAIQQLGAGSGDLAICGGACGGDLLFAEACLKQGLYLELYLPFRETDFIPRSVSFEKDLPGQTPDTWLSRFHSTKNHTLTRIQITPEDLGAPPAACDPYARNNLRQLYTAFSHGHEYVYVIALWNGEAGDGPGGTADMIQQAKARGAKTLIIDTKKVFGL
jgi:hypothetical protein